MILMNMNQADLEPTGARHRGPSLLVVASVFVALFVASIVAVVVMTGGDHFPSPFGPEAASSAFFTAHGRALSMAAFLQLGAAIPLAIFTATAASRLRFLGVQAAGPYIALAGGLLASGMVALSALTQWVLGQSGITTSAEVTRALHLMSFATGGPGFVVPFGILIAGIAVSGGLPRHLPRWLMWSGLVVAVLAELSCLSILTPSAIYFVPLARLGGLLWLIAAGATLAKGRGKRGAASRVVAPVAALEGQGV